MKNLITLFILVFAFGIGTGTAQMFEALSPEVGPGDTYVATLEYNPIYPEYQRPGFIADRDCSPDRSAILAMQYGQLNNYEAGEVWTVNAVGQAIDGASIVTADYRPLDTNIYAYNIGPANSSYYGSTIEVPAAPPGYKLRIEYVPLE